MGGKKARRITQITQMEYDNRAFEQSGYSFSWGEARSFDVFMRADPVFAHHLFGAFPCPAYDQQVSVYNCIACGGMSECEVGVRMSDILRSISSSMKYKDGIVREKKGECPEIPNEVAMCDTCPREAELIKKHAHRGSCKTDCVGKTLLRKI